MNFFRHQTSKLIISPNDEIVSHTRAKKLIGKTLSRHFGPSLLKKMCKYTYIGEGWINRKIILFDVRLTQISNLRENVRVLSMWISIQIYTPE